MAKKNFRDEVGRSRYVAHLLPEALTDAGFWFLLQASRITVTFHAYQWMAKFLSSSEWLVEDYAEFLKEEGSPFQKDSDVVVSFYETLILQMIWADWPAAGSADTELGVLMEPEVCHGETEVYTRVQA
jgi:hypothetical protein